MTLMRRSLPRTVTSVRLESLTYGRYNPAVAMYCSTARGV